MPVQLVTAVWVDVRTANRSGLLVGSIEESDVVVANLWMRDGSASVRVVVIRDVIREYLLSSGCRRGYKGVDPRTLLVWALSFRGLV